MNQKLVTLIGSVVIGGLLLTGGVVALADSTTGSTSDTQKTDVKSPGKGGRMSGQKGDRGGPGGPMDQKGPGNIQDMLASLVKEGIITQETADKITAYYEAKNTERKAEMEKIKAMTEEERKAYFESKKDSAKTTERKEPMSEPVSTGILTQDQADKIKAYTAAQAKVQREAFIKKQLDTLVSSKTITEAQETTVIAYLQQMEENRKAEMEKMKSMTEEERKAALESKKASKDKNTRTSPLTELVSNGTLTQEQADAVAKVLFPQRPDSGNTSRPETKVN